jgi:hypothetical protein
MSNLIARLLCGIAVGALTSWNAIAQNSPSDSNSLKSGAYALQFGVGSNFTLTSFQGSTIALQYHLSESNAIRAGVTFNGNFSDGTDLFNQVTGDTGHTTASGDNSSHSASISFTVQYLWYQNALAPVHFYVGIGPSVSYSYNDQRNAQASTPQTPYFYSFGNDWTRLNYTNTTNQWALGVRGMVGVEWFPARWFSLHADYGEAIQYHWNSNKTTADGILSSSTGANTTITDKGSSKGWAISSIGVSFGASVYF